MDDTREEHYMDTDDDQCVRPFGQRLEGRLYNWKFQSALRYAEEDRVDPLLADAKPNDREMDILRKLADDYGNLGWADGRLADEVRETMRELYQERMADPHAGEKQEAFPAAVALALGSNMFFAARSEALRAIDQGVIARLSKPEIAIFDFLAEAYGDCGEIGNDEIAARIALKTQELMALRPA